MRDREAWHAAVHGVTERWTRLNDLNNEQQRPFCPDLLRQPHPKGVSPEGGEEEGLFPWVWAPILQLEAQN